MKNRLKSRLALGAAVVALAVVAASCPPSPSGVSTEAQIAVAAIDAGVPIGVGYELARSPQTRGYFAAADQVVCAASAGTNVTPAELAADLAQVEGTNTVTPLAEVAVATGVAAFETWYADTGGGTNNADEQAILSAFCAAIEEGESASLPSLKAKSRAAKARWNKLHWSGR